MSPYVNSTTAPSSGSQMSVFAYIGTPPQLRRPSQLLWRQGPIHVIEDVISTQTVQFIFHLGPNYIGSLQAPVTGK